MISAKQADLYAAIGVAIAVMNDSPDPVVQGAVDVLAKFIRDEDALHKVAEREGVTIHPKPPGADALCVWWSMIEADHELAEETIKDGDVILHFMGRGASTLVTARDLRQVVEYLDRCK